MLKTTSERVSDVENNNSDVENDICQMLKTTRKENYNKKRTIKENLGKDKKNPS